KEPARRYGSAKELANDLRRFLTGGAAPKARPSPSRSVSPATWIPAGIIAVVALLVCACVLLRPFLIDAEDPAQRPNEVVVFEKEGPDRDQHDPAKVAYQVAMNQADDAMKARKYAEAVEACDEALKHRPGDEAAIAARKNAQAELAGEARRKEAAYQTAMKQAEAAMQAEQFAQATREYAEALSNRPNDPDAIRGHAQAGRLLGVQEEKRAQEEADRKKALVVEGIAFPGRASRPEAVIKRDWVNFGRRGKKPCKVWM